MTAMHARERLVLDTLVELYDGRARRPYGLSCVDQRAHAVQAGWHALRGGAPATLVAAALLHDVGHMVHGLGEHPAAGGVDDRHEDVGAAWLARWFGPATVEPVRLHVAAKRYLCATEPDYRGRLTRDSVESLALQGGPMSPGEVEAFRARPYRDEAVLLRRIDDAAKDPAGPAVPFASFAGVLVAALRAG
jgi:predicted HD phosphohydrolase